VTRGSTVVPGTLAERHGYVIWRPEQQLTPGQYSVQPALPPNTFGYTSTESVNVVDAASLSGALAEHELVGLADLVTGTESEYTDLVFVDQNEAKIPGEPLRYLGTRLTTALLERQDRRMDRGGGVGEMDPLILRIVNRLS
jgi:hypothetical protein